MGFAANFQNILLSGKNAATLAAGLWMTLKISALSVLAGTLLGALLCKLRTGKFKPLRGLAALYISIARGTPVLMLLMLMYYVVFARAKVPAYIVAVTAFSLNVAAYMAEVMRTALMGVDPGEVEAARTLGMSRWQTFFHVTLPQAVVMAKPTYQSTIINLIQWTSVVGYVTITDLTRVVNNISARTMQPLFMILVGMALYLGLSYLVTGIFWLTGRKNGKKQSA